MSDPLQIAQERIARAAREQAPSLSLSKLELDELPEELFELTHLSVLFAKECGLKQLSPRLLELKKLTAVYLSDNQIKELPEGFGQLTYLQEVYLSNNQLAAVPDSVRHLERLRELYLDGNQLTAISPALARLRSLEILWLGNNQISELAPALLELGALKMLGLDHNQLREIPDYGTAGLHRLQKIYLEGNQLTTVPAFIAALPNLTTLDLRDNQISSLPKELTSTANLRELLLHGNDALGIPELMLGPTLEKSRATHIPVTEPSLLLSYHFVSDEETRSHLCLKVAARAARAVQEARSQEAARLAEREERENAVANETKVHTGAATASNVAGSPAPAEAEATPKSVTPAETPLETGAKVSSPPPDPVSIPAAPRGSGRGMQMSIMSAVARPLQLSRDKETGRETEMGPVAPLPEFDERDQPSFGSSLTPLGEDHGYDPAEDPSFVPTTDSGTPKALRVAKVPEQMPPPPMAPKGTRAEEISEISVPGGTKNGAGKHAETAQDGEEEQTSSLSSSELMARAERRLADLAKTKPGSSNRRPSEEPRSGDKSHAASSNILQAYHGPEEDRVPKQDVQRPPSASSHFVAKPEFKAPRAVKPVTSNLAAPRPVAPKSLKELEEEEEANAGWGKKLLGGLKKKRKKDEDEDVIK